MKKHKICHMTSVHRPNDDRIVLKECVALLDIGYDVSIVFLGDLNEVIDGRIHYVCAGDQYQSRKTRFLKGIWKVYGAAKKINADLYHFHDPELIPVGVLFKLFGKKVIYDVHEDVPKQIMSKEWIKVYFRKPVALLMQFIEKIADIIFDGIIVVLPTIKNKFSKSHCEVIYNYPLKDEMYSNVIWSDRKLVFGYAGGLSIIRGINEICSAAKFYKDITIYIAGDFENNNIKSTILDCKQILYKGYLTREEMKKFYSEIFCGLVLFHPEKNHIESQPVKMKEYMAAGIPFIASDFPEWKKFVDKYKCGICVNPLDINAIADAMKWMVEHPEEAEQMGNNGRKAVIDNFSWEHEKKKLVSFYKKILQ